MTASKGTYSDRVRVSWDLMPDITTYRLYSSAEDSFAGAKSLGLWCEPPCDDFSAAIPVAAASSSGCNGSSSATYGKYYYWVVAVNSAGAGDPSVPDQGWVNGAKSVSAQIVPAGAGPKGLGGDAVLVIALPVMLSLAARFRWCRPR